MFIDTRSCSFLIFKMIFLNVVRYIGIFYKMYPKKGKNKKKSFRGLNYQCMLAKKRKMEFQFDENLNGMRLNGNC